MSRLQPRATALLSVLMWSTLLPCSHAELFQTVPPSYGDVVVTKDGKSNLYISLAPDNIEDDDYTFPVCGSNVNSPQNFNKVIGKQLGYQTCSCKQVPIEGTQEIQYFGAEGINCTGNERHIMWCNIESPKISSKCDQLINVSCKQGDSLYKLASNSEDKSKGQVLLYPPSPLDRHNATLSMGLVAVKERQCNNGYWRFIYVTSENVDWSLANTVCQMNGFTRVSSILTKEKAEAIFNITFRYWIDIFKSSLTFNQILNTSDVNCGELRQPCLRCCDYKFCDCQPQISNHLDNFESLLVLRCSFDSSKRYSGSNIAIDCETNSEEISRYDRCYADNFDNIPVNTFQLRNKSGQTGNSQGQLEYYWNMKWRTVCTSNFDQNETDAVCKKMGYLRGKLSQEPPNRYVNGVDTTPIIFIKCSNNRQTSCKVHTSSTCTVTSNVVHLECFENAPYDWKETTLIIVGIVGFIIAILIIVLPMIFLRSKKGMPINPETQRLLQESNTTQYTSSFQDTSNESGPTSPDLQKTALDESELMSPDMQRTPNGSEKPPLDTQKTPNGIGPTSPDMQRTPNGSGKPPLDMQKTPNGLGPMSPEIPRTQR